MKVCSKCKEAKAKDMYNKSSNTSDGLYPCCKDCRKIETAAYRAKNRPRLLIQKRADWYRNRESHLQRKNRAQMKHKYGLSLEQYDAMLKKQNGVCAICFNPESVSFKGEKKRLCVDHCHETGVVRGLLCSKCNSGIGFFEEYPARMERALTYVFVGGFDGLQ